MTEDVVARLREYCFYLLVELNERNALSSYAPREESAVNVSIPGINAAAAAKQQKHPEGFLTEGELPFFAQLRVYVTERSCVRLCCSVLTVCAGPLSDHQC